MAVIIRDGRPSDVAATHRLIKELAVYERAAQEMVLSEEALMEDGFGAHPIYQLFVAELDEEVIGIALIYEKYSTWKGRSIYLEDLIVTEKHRGIGAGKLLFERVIKAAYESKAGRMDWQVLDWNEPSIAFYKRYGATLDGEWINGSFSRGQLEELGAKL